MKRTSEWRIYSRETPNDVTVNAAGTSFTLHKFPLVSKCGHLRKLVSQSSDADVSTLDIPGGAEAFEAAAKFCYGINFEITTDNIAMLRCVAEYLEMTEEVAAGNLVGRAEAYITEVALKSLPGAVSVLHSSEKLLPTAEKVKLVSRCIDAIAFMACKDTLFASPGQGSKPVVDWWAEDLTLLRIDFFQRVVIAMVARGFRLYALAPILMLYAQKSLRGLDISMMGRNKIEPREEHGKRVVVETIAGLLPREKNAVPVSFLSRLLKAAIFLETTVACRLDLEKRVASQLGQAAVDDLLIPSYSSTGGTLFAVETVQRIMINFLESEMEANYKADHEDYRATDFEHVTKLMENCLSEIASDPNLSVSTFTCLAELIPEHSRLTEDGMYRAIDIYLKVHPALSDTERKKACSVMNCQKLSREACAHAAQNERLPVQTVVQVLQYQQQRLREVMDEPPAHPVTDELSTLRRENQGLKMEVAKMKMRMKEIERFSSDKTLVGSSTRMDKPPLRKKSFISFVSKKLGWIIRADGDGDGNGTNPDTDRRHSMS